MVAVLQSGLSFVQNAERFKKLIIKLNQPTKPMSKEDKLKASKPCINNDGTANKNHVRKMWNIALNTMIDDQNNSLDDDDYNARVNEFKAMANQLASHPTN